jgi:hypothetical protein
MKLSKLIRAKINSYPTAHQMERWAELAEALEQDVAQFAARTQGELFTATPTPPAGAVEIARVRKPVAVGALVSIERELSAQWGKGLTLRDDGGEFFVIEMQKAPTDGHR